jgi:hypothetical protein
MHPTAKKSAGISGTNPRRFSFTKCINYGRGAPGATVIKGTKKSFPEQPDIPETRKKFRIRAETSFWLFAAHWSAGGSPA